MAGHWLQDGVGVTVCGPLGWLEVRRTASASVSSSVSDFDVVCDGGIGGEVAALGSAVKESTGHVVGAAVGELEVRAAVQGLMGKQVMTLVCT